MSWSVPPCVVFDLDDTLFLEVDYVRSGFRAVGRYAQAEWGLAGLGDACWEAFQAGVRHRVFDTVLAGAGIEATPGAVGALVQAYRSHVPDIGLLPDAAACLSALAGRVSLAVVTDGPAVSQRNKAAALGAEGWSALSVFTAELGEGHSKPDPLAFQMVQEACGWAGADCLYLADNPAKDFAGPARLGWRTARIRRPAGLHAGVPSGPDVQREEPSLDWLAALATQPAR